MDRIAPEEQEALAVALEEAAARVRMQAPVVVRSDYHDHQEFLDDGGNPIRPIPGQRWPALRSFHIEWEER